MTAARSSGSFGKPNPTPEETCAEQYPEGCPPLIEATAQMNLIIKMVESVQKLLQETHDATVVQATKMVTVEKTLDLLNKSLSGMEVTGSSHDTLTFRVKKLEKANSTVNGIVIGLLLAVMGSATSWLLGFVHLGALAIQATPK